MTTFSGAKVLAVSGAAGVILALGLLQAPAEALDERAKRITDEMLRSGPPAPAQPKPAPAAAAPVQQPDDVTVQSKDITGEVVYVSRRSLSIEYKRSGGSLYEMLIPVDADTKVERVSSLAELKRGDRVRVHFNQLVKAAAEGEEPRIVKTVATKVALVREASPEGTLRSSTRTETE